jgi:predicted DNA-binding protein (UPF0251 family)
MYKSRRKSSDPEFLLMSVNTVAQNERINQMTNYREILRLASLGLNRSQIADSLDTSRTTVIHTLQRAAAQEVTWQAAEPKSDKELAALLFPGGEGTPSYSKVIAGYKKVRLLILDEWLLYPPKDIEARDLLEIAESRHKKGSTIFCSQFDVGGWHAQIGEPTLADAVVDRIVHDSYPIVIEGKESMRKRKGIPED